MFAFDFLLTGLLVFLIAGSITFYLACAWYTYRFFTTPEPPAKDFMPPVSILVPVRGLDAGAWDNGASLCQQHYSKYEVWFGVMDPNDPAVPLLQQLVAAFPDRARLLTDLPPLGINHKDSNLSYLLARAAHEHIVLVDSDIRVDPDYLHRIVTPLADPQVGLVTCAFVGKRPRSLEAALAALGRCVDFLPGTLIARSLDGGLRFAVGATMATRKDTLEKAGGLHFNRIGSDYNLGKRVAAVGYWVELSRYVMESDTGREGISEVFQRELRWARTIRFNRGAQYYAMIFCYGTAYCLPLLLLSDGANWAIALSIVTWGVRLVAAAIAIVYTRRPGLATWLWTLPLRDFLSLMVWGIGAFGDRVYWRGRWLRIEGNGIIKET
ncbi:MAG: glycosyltransferase [Coleofasciculaceae cyanobacterium SM2_3_26]|nr:glycosyltransferase [Coleofasciculaceae cyanobacterium SM2_3_26]